MQDHHRRDRERDKRFARACAIQPHMDISQKPLPREFDGKMPNPRTWKPPCASLHSLNAPGHTRRSVLRNYQQECRAPGNPGALRHIMKASVPRILEEYGVPPDRGAEFARACPVKMPSDISDKPYGAPRSNPSLNSYCKNF